MGRVAGRFRWLEREQRELVSSVRAAGVAGCLLLVLHPVHTQGHDSHDTYAARTDPDTRAIARVNALAASYLC
jgi:hypothetical protein